MRIGIFDSGIGGLVILRGIKRELPQYDYLYLGDTKRVPYGNRSQAQIYEFVKQGVKYLFKNDCKLIILACNTASAKALRKIQQEYLPKHFPDRRVLGIIIPTVEVAKKYKQVGVLATLGTVKSKAYEREFRKFNPNAKVFSKPAPLLVELIENDKVELSDEIIRRYVKPFIKINPDCLILGCTHYPIIEKQIAKFLPKKIKLLSQEKIIPEKLKNYLKRHPEIERDLNRNSKIEINVTKLADRPKQLLKKWFRNKVKSKLVKI